MDHVRTHLHQLQLATWEVVTQDYAIFYGLSIFPEIFYIESRNLK